MRLFWNTGAALLLSAALIAVTSLASLPRNPAWGSAIVSPKATTSPEPPHRGAPLLLVSRATPHRHYASLREHFQAANTSNDGKLTLDQARADGWSRVVQHFDEIDTAHAGFLSVEQIHAYNTAHRHAHRGGDT